MSFFCTRVHSRVSHCMIEANLFPPFNCQDARLVWKKMLEPAQTLPGIVPQLQPEHSHSRVHGTIGSWPLNPANENTCLCFSPLGCSLACYLPFWLGVVSLVYSSFFFFFGSHWFHGSQQQNFIIILLVFHFSRFSWKTWRWTLGAFWFQWGREFCGKWWGSFSGRN